MGGILEKQVAAWYRQGESFVLGSLSCLSSYSGTESKLHTPLGHHWVDRQIYTAMVTGPLHVEAGCSCVCFSPGWALPLAVQWCSASRSLWWVGYDGTCAPGMTVGSAFSLCSSIVPRSLHFHPVFHSGKCAGVDYTTWLSLYLYVGDRLGLYGNVRGFLSHIFWAKIPALVLISGVAFEQVVILFMPLAL